MINEHINDYLIEYCFSTTPPKYAVMLKGSWGSGKTWFIENFIKELKSKGGNELYVSLYGVSSTTAIENEFYRKLHPILSHKGMEIAGKIFKGAIKASLKIDINGDGKEDGTVNTSIPDIKIPEYLSDTSSRILIFDDIERRSMDISELLGYINYFVEHQDYKVILISNEQEIIKKDEKYISLKEKLVGKTFEINPDIDSALEKIIQETSSPETLSPLIETIKTVIHHSKHKNLRHLRQALLDFSRFEEKLPQEINDAPGLLEHLLQIHLMLTFEFRHGNLCAEDILNLKDKYIRFSTSKAFKKDAAPPEPPAYAILKKYQLPFGLDILMNEEIWIDIIDNGRIDVPIIVKSLNHTKYLLKENTPKWMQLWNFRSHHDNEFSELLDAVHQQLKNLEFEEVSEVKHVFGLLLYFSEEGLLEVSQDELFKASIGCINHLRESGKLSQKRVTRSRDNISAYGMGFIKRESQEFILLCKEIAEIEEKAFEDTFPQHAESLLSLLTENPQKFSSSLDFTGGESTYADTPILNSIPIEKFVNTLLELTPDQIYQALNFLLERYSYQSTANKVSSERKWIISLQEQLTIEAQKRAGKISGACIRELLSRNISTALANLDTQAQPQN